MEQIIIHVENGLIQAIYANSKDVLVDICDLDYDDAERASEIEVSKQRIEEVKNDPKFSQIY